MPTYYARVELHDADEDDYESLRELLALEGFSHCHTPDKVSKRLPTGFYKGTRDEEKVGEVAKIVKSQADVTGCKSEIVVVKSNGIKSYLSKNCE